MEWKWVVDPDTGDLVKSYYKAPKKRVPKPKVKKKPRVYSVPEHGTPARYANRKFRCRCPECKSAYSKYTKQMRMTKFKRNGDTVEHGKYTTYTTWNCRCVPCSEAMFAYNRSRRERSNELRRNARAEGRIKPPTPEQQEARRKYKLEYYHRKGRAKRQQANAQAKESQ